jgi:hypothetical protein
VPLLYSNDLYVSFVSVFFISKNLAALAVISRKIILSSQSIRDLGMASNRMDRNYFSIMFRCVSVKLLLLIFCLALYLLIMTSYYVDVNFGVKRSALSYYSTAVRFEDCKIPDYNPFHSSVKKYLKDAPPVNCSNIQFSLTFVDSDRTIHVNTSAVDELKKQNPNVTDVKCYYKAISRTVNEDEEHDVSVDFSEDEVIQVNFLL